MKFAVANDASDGAEPKKSRLLVLASEHEMAELETQLDRAIPEQRKAQWR
jgi:hypothetical protein